MTITTSDMGGFDRTEKSLEQHRINLTAAIRALGGRETIEKLVEVATDGDIDSADGENSLKALELLFASTLRDLRK